MPNSESATTWPRFGVTDFMLLAVLLRSLAAVMMQNISHRKQ
jgi:hypothetical protein